MHGGWPEIAQRMEPVDVVVCNHVAYNLPDLDVAVLRMTELARRRVMLELTTQHPRAPQNFLWEEFHGITRPERSTSDDAVAVIRECGIAAHAEEWTPDDLTLCNDDMDAMVASVRRYLCVGADRDADIARALEPHLLRRDGIVGLPPRPVTTIWWDAPAA